jgi:hypothetical protein
VRQALTLFLLTPSSLDGVKTIGVDISGISTSANFPLTTSKQNSNFFDGELISEFEGTKKGNSNSDCTTFFWNVSSELIEQCRTCYLKRDHRFHV